jgi:hypothetical protein
MTYTLFLDDIRDPTWDLGQDVYVVRTVSDAVTAVAALGVPVVISFDHDLGKREPTAMEFMWFLVESHLDKTLDLNAVKRIIIHSANPVGAANLAGLWNGFARHELQTGVVAEIKPRS